MTLELPREVDVLDQRLQALEDPDLAARLASSHPLHFPRAVSQQADPGRSRRFGSIALAITAAASLVAGALLAPLVVHRQAAPPLRVAPIASPAPAHARHAAHAAPLRLAVPLAAAPLHHALAAPAQHAAAPAVHAAAPAIHAAPVAEAHRASVPVAHAAPAPLEHPHAIANAAPAAHPASEAANAPGDGQINAQSPGTSAQGGVRVSFEDANEVLPPPGGTKGPPPGSVLPTAMGEGGGPVMAGRDDCSPHGGRTGIVMHMMGR